MRSVSWTVTLAFVVTAAGTITWAHGPHRKPVAIRATPAELAAYEMAKPALQKHCFRCHTTKGMKAKPKARKHLNLDRYPPRGHHAYEAGAAIKRVLVGDKAKGEGPSMPSDDPGTVMGQELDSIIAWAETFERARAEQATKKSGSVTKAGTAVGDAGAVPHAH